MERIPLAEAVWSEEAASPTAPEAWLLWQLADASFPSGGFAHSSGLEAAWRQGQARTSEELASLIEISLDQLASAALPLLHAAYDHPDQAASLDRLCDSFLSNHVANRASRLQGRAWLSSCRRIFPSEELRRLAGAFPFSHFAPVFGAVCRALGIGRLAAGGLFFFQHLRGLLSAAVRLGIVGPMEAQTLQHRLSSQARDLLAQSENLGLDDLAQTAPLLEIWQGAHDRLYSRLFQS